MKRTERFLPFYNGVFCQWHQSPMWIDGVLYNCAEQYMMAKKALVHDDGHYLDLIMNTDNPAKQKEYGRAIRWFDEARWNAIARDVVARASLAKFTSTPKLRAALICTAGFTLVEASPTDPIWGVGLSEEDPRVHDRSQWQGTNWLGQVLTETRESLLYGVPRGRL